MNEAPAACPSTDYSDALDAIDSSVRSADEMGESKSEHAQDHDEILSSDSAPFDHKESVGSEHESDQDNYGEYDHESSCSSIVPTEHVERSHDMSTSDRVGSHYESAQSYASMSEQSDYYESEDSEDESKSEQCDESDFPPGHITTLAEMEGLQSRRKSTGSFNSSHSDSLNPSILPTYFFCPLTERIMKDPVITPDGNTYERLTILRYLTLDESDPLTGNPLRHEELKEDKMVKGKIEKCRREAWMRYVMEFDKKAVNKIMHAQEGLSLYESNRVYSEDESGHETTGMNTTNDDTDEGELNQSNYSKESEDNIVLVNTTSSEEPNYPQSLNQNANLLKSNFEGILPVNTTKHIKADVSISSSQPTAANMHGWNTPLGVHKIVCSPPGLSVTADPHRRSAVIKRKVVKKTLVTKSSKKKQSDDTLDIIESQVSSSRGGNKPQLSPKKKKKLKTVLSVSSQELILPPGSHVEVLETAVHGGRVRGNITWEEEMAVELDDELLAQMKMLEGAGESEGDQSAGISSKSKKKSKSFFRRKDNQQGKNPFSSDLFAESPYCHETDAKKESSQSPHPLTIVKYSGWISLEWAGNNREREEAAAKLRNGCATMSDEKVGPWSQALSLGVYRITGDWTSGHVHSESPHLTQLPLSDSADSDRNITDILVKGQYIEIVETKVVVMTSKIINGRQPNQHLGIHSSDGICGVRTVRARCMVPVLIPPMIPEHVNGMRCVNARPQKKFKSGWISLCTDDISIRENASSLPIGAYTIVADSGCTVTEGHRTDSKIKYTLPCKSCIEIVTTRIEFEENEESITCRCGRESTYSVVAVRALIASGGHLTLFVFPISASGSVDNVCYCGQFVQRTIAEPVPLGMYKITHPDGVMVFAGIGTESPTISSIKENACVKVLQTGVEDGCVRGRISMEGDSVAGWIILFQFPDKRWAEYVSEKDLFIIV